MAYVMLIAINHKQSHTLNKEVLKPTKETMYLYIHVISISVSIVNIIVRNIINTHADNI